MLISSFHLYRDKRGVMPIRLPESGQRWRKWGDPRALRTVAGNHLVPLRPAHHQSTYLAMRSGLVTWVWAGGLLQRSQDSALRQAAFQSRMGAFPTIQPRAW